MTPMVDTASSLLQSTCCYALLALLLRDRSFGFDVVLSVGKLLPGF
jgi:hypothetical protein